jgi:hypothetical protein
MGETKDDFGPLPQSDRNAELQRISFVAIQGAFPSDKFVFRDERVEDAGVDGSLELLVGSGQTNLRSQIQLKGTDSDKFNADGSFSLQVDVSNLNYLIYGVCPIYLLYIVPIREFRFVWARDEKLRLDRENPRWMEQEKVTFRFTNMLTPKTLAEIYERVLREGRMHRRIHDALAVASVTERVTVGIDPETLSVTSAAEAYRTLFEGGFTMVASGYAPEVIRQAQLLNTEQISEARIQLVLAYADYVMSRYQSAISHIQQVGLRRHELSPDDLAFMTFLRNVCDFQAGRIDLSEYCRRVDEWTRTDKSGFALANRLDSTRYKLLKEPNITERERIFDELRAVASEVLKRGDSSAAFNLEAATVLLFANAGQRLVASIQEIVGIPLRIALGLPVDLQAALGSLGDEAWKEWEEQLGNTLRSTVGLNHPLLEAFALLTRANVRSTRLINLQLLADCTEIYVELPEILRLQAMVDAENAMKIYERAGQLEGALRAQMHLADLYLLGRQSGAAQALARHVLPQAAAMDYSMLVERATEHIEGRAISDHLRAMYEFASTADPDVGLANMTDEEARAFALDICEVKGIPLERLPVAERDAFALREIAKERLGWCRHIDLMQDPTHTESLATIYGSDLKHDVVCEKYDYRTNIGSPEYGEVIASFKRQFCDGCAGREPKQ